MGETKRGVIDCGAKEVVLILAAGYSAGNPLEANRERALLWKIPAL